MSPSAEGETSPALHTDCAPQAVWNKMSLVLAARLILFILFTLFVQRLSDLGISAKLDLKIIDIFKHDAVKSDSLCSVNI